MGISASLIPGRSTGGADTGTEEGTEVKVGLHPRKKYIIKLFQEHHVIAIILLHCDPTGWIIGHTPDPEGMTLVFILLTNLESLCNIVELVTRKAELLSHDLE
jgi:hypothetical protein